MFSGKTILITGGSGSFGKEMTKELLANYNPKTIRIFSRGEELQRQMQEELNNDSRLRFLIGDIRDYERLNKATNGVDIVIHAAALKQIPTSEYNPLEACKTNIDGAKNLINACINNKVEKVIALSTDKASQPQTLYGATKLVMERLITQANVYVGSDITKFACTRYGNVLNSRGSVIPIFKQQKEKGELTITDERMTRFWLTLEQGVKFVIDSIDRMQGGEIFIPKIPSMKVIDVADAIAPDTIKKVIGIRAGEKLHEVLFAEEESRHTREYGDYFVILPEFAIWDKYRIKASGIPTKITRYSSDTNIQWLTKEQLLAMIK